MNTAAILEKGISEIFALQAELGLSDKGFSLSQVDYSYKYLGINVLPKVRFGNDMIEGFGFLGSKRFIFVKANSLSCGVEIVATYKVRQLSKLSGGRLLPRPAGLARSG